MEEIRLETMRCQIEDGLARIVLTQAERGNPIDGDMGRDLCDLTARLTMRPDVRAVLLTSEGRFFSVGGDIRSFLKDRDALPGNVIAWTATLHMAVSRLQRMNAPVVCAVQGDVAGGSVALAAAADVLLAADGVRFNAAFAMIGYCADSGSTVALASRMGQSRAKRFLLLSEVLTATEAQAAGLVDFVHPAAALAAEAQAIACRLAAGPTLAYGEIKRTMMSARTTPLESQLENEAQALARIAGTDDAWEGLSAFGERRKPQFRGR